MSEEIEHRITEIEKRLSDIEIDIYLVDRRIWHLIKDILSEGGRKASLTGWYRRYEKEGLVEKAEDTLRRLVDTERVYEAYKYIRIEKYDNRDRLIEEKVKLEEDLEWHKLAYLPPPEEIIPPVEVPEFIDIDDATGYLIMYSRDAKGYFLVRPDDYEKGKIESEKYFSTLEVATNFTFDTEAASKYEGGPKRYLEAECRITARVREAGKKLSDAIPEKLKEAFERHITFFFEQSFDRGKGAGTWKGGMKHIIADGVDYTGKHDVEVGKKISEMLGVKVLKVGVFYRLTDENPNMIIEEEYARPKVSGEWSRKDYSESVSREFNVEHELSQPLHWSMVRGFVGETGWEQLKRIKEEEK